MKYYKNTKANVCQGELRHEARDRKKKETKYDSFSFHNFHI